jgi:hypothetical protein
MERSLVRGTLGEPMILALNSYRRRGHSIGGRHSSLAVIGSQDGREVGSRTDLDLKQAYAMGSDGTPAGFSPRRAAAGPLVTERLGRPSLGR